MSYNKRVTCDICSKIYWSSNRTSHRGTEFHRSFLKPLDIKKEDEKTIKEYYCIVCKRFDKPKYLYHHRISKLHEKQIKLMKENGFTVEDLFNDFCNIV